MEKITLTSFLVSINVCAIASATGANNHSYTPMEDAAAYYFAKYGVTDKDLIDMAVFKLNQRHGQTNLLTKSSFMRRITNMNFTLTNGGNGLKNNSEQGKLVANTITKMFHQNKLDKFLLRDMLNDFMGSKVL